LGYLLQYQAHVDDLTSLAGNPEDTSWFFVQPFESPRRATIPDEGIVVGDITSGAVVVPDDQSWLILRPDEQPESERLLPIGFFAGDLDSAGAQPEDTSWFLVEPFTSQPPVRPSLRPEHEGLYVGDRDSLAGVPEDVSWFVFYPYEVPLERKVAPAGHFAADLSSAEGIIYTSLGIIHLVSIGLGNEAPFFEATIRATVGMLHARLYNLTTDEAVANSEVSTTSATDTVVRSAAMDLTNAHKCRAQFGKAGSDAGDAIGAEIVVVP